MHLQLLFLIPALAAIIWALVVKFKDRKIFEGVTLSICAIALAINVLVVHKAVVHGHASDTMHFVQMLFSSAIVPLAYMYFSRQLGRRWNNLTTVLSWSLVLLLLLPNVTIFLGSDRTITDPELIGTFRVCFVRDGRVVFSCFTADLVIFFQAMFTVTRMIPAAITMRKYGLKLSTKMSGFYFWWGAAVAFIIFTSFASLDFFRTPVGGTIYYASYSFLITSIFVMLALRFELNPVVTKEEGETVGMDEFIDANKDMAARLRVLLDTEKIYLHQGYTADDAATALGTNRTYFSRMMNAEFGMKFSDLVAEYRIKMAKTLLATTDKTVSDIALETGFTDASYMNKKFHQIVGMTPRMYRNTKA